jgi:hypothetical protein
MTDIPDTVTVYVTIRTPATCLFQVPAVYDGYIATLISVEVEGHTVPRAALARLLHPDMFAQIARLSKTQLAAVLAEDAA